MNKYPYPAVLLMGYQRLGGLIERLEWTVYNRALATHGFSGAFPLSTLEQVSEIIKLIDRKTLLSELKKTVVRCLNRMESRSESYSSDILSRVMRPPRLRSRSDSAKAAITTASTEPSSVWEPRLRRRGTTKGGFPLPTAQICGSASCSGCL